MGRQQLTKTERFDIAKSFGWNCVYCECRVSFYPDKFGGSMAHIDHIIPVSKGGTNCRKNLVLSCQGCNLQKATADNLVYKITIREADCACGECNS